MADLTKYVVLRKWDPTQLAEAAVTGAAPDETWEPIGTADAATGPKAIEAVLDGKVTESDDHGYRAVPLRFWGEEYGANVKVVSTVSVAPLNPTSAPPAEPAEQPELEPAE